MMTTKMEEALQAAQIKKLKYQNRLLKLQAQNTPQSKLSAAKLRLKAQIKRLKAMQPSK